MDRKRCDRSLGSKEEGVETARVFREEVPFFMGLVDQGEVVGRWHSGIVVIGWRFGVIGE